MASAPTTSSSQPTASASADPATAATTNDSSAARFTSPGGLSPEPTSRTGPTRRSPPPRRPPPPQHPPAEPLDPDPTQHGCEADARQVDHHAVHVRNGVARQAEPHALRQVEERVDEHAPL